MSSFAKEFAGGVVRKRSVYENRIVGHQQREARAVHHMHQHRGGADAPPCQACGLFCHRIPWRFCRRWWTRRWICWPPWSRLSASRTPCGRPTRSTALARQRPRRWRCCNRFHPRFVGAALRRGAGASFPTPGYRNEAVGYGIMIFAIVMTLGCSLFSATSSTAQKSMAIGADRLHYSGDILINAAVDALSGFSRKRDRHGPIPCCARHRGDRGVGSLANFAPGSAARRKCLMDRELPKAGREKIKELARAQPGVLDARLRTRSDGEHVFIEIHLEMDPSIANSCRARHRQIRL